MKKRLVVVLLITFLFMCLYHAGALDLQAEKVLVVGGNGFLGSAICRRLIQAGQSVSLRQNFLYMKKKTKGIDKSP